MLKIWVLSSGLGPLTAIWALRVLSKQVQRICVLSSCSGPWAGVWIQIRPKSAILRQKAIYFRLSGIQLQTVKNHLFTLMSSAGVVQANPNDLGAFKLFLDLGHEFESRKGPKVRFWGKLGCADFVVGRHLHTLKNQRFTSLFTGYVVGAAHYMWELNVFRPIWIFTTAFVKKLALKIRPPGYQGRACGETPITSAWGYQITKAQYV